MSLIIAMCAFSFSMSVSPGPVNLICLSSGINYGFRKTLPFVSGATIGFVILLSVIGFGLGVIATNTAYLFDVLPYLGSGFIGYMAFKILTANGQLTTEAQNSVPPTFIQGILLQWLNPKAWMACFAGTAAFNVDDSNQTLLLFICIYFATCYAGIACWALIGDKVGAWLTNPHNIKRFNALMGTALLFVSIYLIVI